MDVNTRVSNSLKANCEDFAGAVGFEGSQTQPFSRNWISIPITIILSVLYFPDIFLITLHYFIIIIILACPQRHRRQSPGNDSSSYYKYVLFILHTYVNSPNMPIAIGKHLFNDENGSRLLRKEDN